MYFHQNIPRFSIFLPVHNGGKFLGNCIRSILDQTVEDFELIILENSSTDDTVDIIQSIDDKRIQVYPSCKLLTISENWQRISGKSKSEYITLIAHDDLLDANYLEVMESLINEFPKAGLYQTHFRLIDNKGECIRLCSEIPTFETVSGFLKARMLYCRDSFGTGYMMRTKDYEKVGGIPLYPNLLFSDDALWIKLMLDSYKVCSKLVCFSYRMHMNSMSGNCDNKIFFRSFNLYLHFLNDLAQNHFSIYKVTSRLYHYYRLLTFLHYYYGQFKIKVRKNIL